jgi:hypothetical protein
MQEETSQPETSSTSPRAAFRQADGTGCPWPAGCGVAIKAQARYVQLLFEAVTRGADTLLMEECARKDSNGKSAIDFDRVQFFLAVLAKFDYRSPGQSISTFDTIMRDLEQASFS